MSSIDISIIIPCYNANPEHLREAVNSIYSYKGKYSYEIIVINDGSTNEATLKLLSELENNNVHVIYQENNGPSHARNTGVKQSNGEYLLCLDSDNKIHSSYIDEGIDALLKNPKVAVAYGNPEFIGNINRAPFITGPFSIEKLLLEGYIDMCAVIRKSAWHQCAGLDESLWRFEDWEFWIRVYKAGWRFVYLNKLLFQYRIRDNSLMSGAINDDHKKMIGFLYVKHADLAYKVLHSLYARSIIYSNDVKRPLRSFIKYVALTFRKQERQCQ